MLLAFADNYATLGKTDLQRTRAEGAQELLRELAKVASLGW